jgi:hypothetical protein
MFRVLEEFRHILGADLARVGAAGVQKRAAGAVNRAHHILVQPDRIAVDAFLIVAVQLQQAAPPAANADDLMALVHRAIDDRFDAGVKTGDITAAGQNANPHFQDSLQTDEIEI